GRGSRGRERCSGRRCAGRRAEEGRGRRRRRLPRSQLTKSQLRAAPGGAALIFCLPMVAFFRARTRLWAVAGLWTGLLLTGFNLYAAAVTYIPQFRVRNDFRLVYGAALTAWRQ